MATTWRPHRRHPLGLPPGSVESLLTLLVVSVVIVRAVRGQPLDILWSGTLMIVLAHYFAARNVEPVSGGRDPLEKAAVPVRQPRPLYVPRNAIRIAIILSFVGLVIYLYHKHRLWHSAAVESIWIVFVYLLGVVLRWLTDWGCRAFGIVPRWWWVDAKAAVVLVSAASCVGFYLADQSDLLLPWQRKAVLSLIVFYFGSSG